MSEELVAYSSFSFLKDSYNEDICMHTNTHSTYISTSMNKVSRVILNTNVSSYLKTISSS